MPNYGEEVAYWYLRLNGFFPIPNFVVHKSKSVRHTSDVDLMAIRLPYVFEEVGGKRDDWDLVLLNLFQPDLPVGVVCEVKTGEFDSRKIFRDEILSYAVARFGFTPNFQGVIGILSKNALVVEDDFQVAKILFSNSRPETIENQGMFIHIPLGYARDFISARIGKYPKEKFGDRMFFSSLLVQDMIDSTVLNANRYGGW